MDARIPLSIRILLLVLIFLCTTLYFLGQYLTGTTFGITINMNGAQSDVIILKKLNMYGSISEMWKARVYALASIIAICSVTWPHVKMISTLLIYCLPQKIQSVKFRTNFLFVLDIFGKWSLIDCYILIIIVTAFRFHIKKKLFIFEGGGDMTVLIGPGPFVFFIATFISLGINNTLVYYNKQLQYSKDFLDSSASIMRKSISDYVKPAQKFGLVLMILLSLLLLFVGMFVNTFIITFEGLGGYLLGTSRVREYSIFTLGNDLTEAASRNNKTLMEVTTLTYFLFALLCPIAYLLLYLILWLFPFKIKH